MRGSCAESGPTWANGRSPLFGGYALASEIGPVALAMSNAPSGISVETSHGTLILRSISSVTFRAQWRPTAGQVQLASATPVPALSSAGLGLVAAMVAGIGISTVRLRNAG